MGRPEGIYALYKGEEFLDMGTKKEMAARRGVKVETMHYWSSKANKRRIESRKYQNALRIIRIDNTEEEDE